MPVILGQIIYTSLPGVGLKTLASVDVPTKIQQAFLQQVVYQHWNSYKPPMAGYCAVYIHQVTLEHTLFGWLYNDGFDDLDRSHIPYFICYFLAEQLHAVQLENIFVCLHRGPLAVIDRQSPPNDLETLVVPNLSSYQPARIGVAIPADVRDHSHIALQQRRLLDLFVPVDEHKIITSVNSQTYNQQATPVQPLVTAMTSPSPDKSNNRNLTTEEPEQTARRQESPDHREQGRREWSLKAKATVWAIAVSTLPLLAVGTTYYLGSQSITKQITQARLAGATDLTATEALHRQQSLLLLGTGVTAVLAGAIAAIVANRALRPVLSAAAASTTIVNKLRRQEVGTRARAVGKDELVALETNISLIEEHLPDLLWQQEANSERFQVLMNITRRIQESFSEENVFRTTVEEVRKTFRSDRVVIFRLDSNSDGTFVEESVAPGWPKTLWSTIHDPCFEGGYIEQYRKGRVCAIDNIYKAGLTDCYIGLLERFAVKASLIAPIMKDNQLFGLLIVHQCSGPRFWEQSEIDLCAQLATQVGFALDHARLLEQVDSKADRAQVFIEITSRIRESLNEEDVLRTTVEEVRKAIRTDRVIVYGFDSNWYGTVIAESVVPGFPKALRAKIKDPCFEEGYVEKYQAGRVQATNNIYEAGLTACYINQLEPFAVKANLVAPILKDGHLFGLLIAHECSGPRDWQQFEVNLFAQLATQVGFALDHARLLDQVEQAYQAAETAFDKQSQQKEALQRQVSELLRDSKTSVDTLLSEALGQMESITTAYNQIQAVADSAQGMIASAQQAKLQDQQLNQMLQDGHEAMNRALDCICALRETVVEAAKKVKRRDQPSQKLSQMVSLIGQVASQMQIQAMSAALEAARTGTGQEFASIAEKVVSLARQLNAGIAKIKPLVAEIQTETNEVVSAMDAGTEQAIAGAQLVEETQQKLNSVATVSAQVKTLEELTQAAAFQAQTLNSVSQSVLEFASIANQTSEQSLAVAESLAKLETVGQ